MGYQKTRGCVEPMHKVYGMRTSYRKGVLYALNGILQLKNPWRVDIHAEQSMGWRSQCRIGHVWRRGRGLHIWSWFVSDSFFIRVVGHGIHYYFCRRATCLYGMNFTIYNFTDTATDGGVASTSLFSFYLFLFYMVI